MLINNMDHTFFSDICTSCAQPLTFYCKSFTNKKHNILFIVIIGTNWCKHLPLLNKCNENFNLSKLYDISVCFVTIPSFEAVHWFICSRRIFAIAERWPLLNIGIFVLFSKEKRFSLTVKWIMEIWLRGVLCVYWLLNVTCLTSILL